jgi:hypothetical protein
MRLIKERSFFNEGSNNRMALFSSGLVFFNGRGLTSKLKKAYTLLPFFEAVQKLHISKAFGDRKQMRHYTMREEQWENR